MPKKRKDLIRPDMADFVRLAGRRIRAVREIARLSQSDVAGAIGVDQSIWSKWESGDRTPDPLAIIQFCNRFRVSLDFIYLGNPANTHPQLLELLRQSKPDLLAEPNRTAPDTDMALASYMAAIGIDH